ncbi:DUF4129 domain-containing protein [Actinomadura flavalba]|uniref:DUF4129 domain-containing protein n=1 Tax=Actinomadura flavalba TaxID=1120938 RepID=UPI000372A4FA|nr:DUF4129 domain-containing protein [Actinomadura flavalba]
MTVDPIGRDEAAELARRELDRPLYHQDDPSWAERTFRRFSEWLGDLMQRAQEPGTPSDGSGWFSLGVVLVVLAIVVVLVVWLLRGRRNVRSERDALLDAGRAATAVDHRVEAERHAAAGRWRDAIRERLRALARDLEERAIVEPRPGRTADELATEAGAALPDLAAPLRAGVRVFDDVWYGDRPGSAEHYAQLKALDERVQKTRPKRLEAAGDVPSGGSGRW